MTSVSTDWNETIAPDEEDRHRRLTEAILEIQTRVNAKSGPGRAFHRKQVAALSGRLVVHDALPEYAAQGLFAEPGEYEVVARLSNGAMVTHPDLIPDVRGFAFSVRGLDAEGALTASTDRQDFLLIDLPSFGFRDSADFAQIVQAAGSGPLGTLKHLIGRDGVVAGLTRAATQAARIAVPFTGFATTDFHSCAPITWGPYAAQVHLRPRGAGINPLAWRDYGADMRGRIAKGDVRWDVQAQFYSNPSDTPIEDLRSPWDSSKVTVGELILDSPADDQAVEQDRFDPWSALAEHRPLGDVMRARKAAYFRSVQNRQA